MISAHLGGGGGVMILNGNCRGAAVILNCPLEHIVNKFVNWKIFLCIMTGPYIHHKSPQITANHHKSPQINHKSLQITTNQFTFVIFSLFDLIF